MKATRKKDTEENEEKEDREAKKCIGTEYTKKKHSWKMKAMNVTMEKRVSMGMEKRKEGLYVHSKREIPNRRENEAQ